MMNVHQKNENLKKREVINFGKVFPYKPIFKNYLGVTRLKHTQLKTNRKNNMDYLP